MPAVPKEPQMRINGFKKDYKFWSYLHASLNRANPNLDYFHFAYVYQGTRRATNNHFRVLLIKLSNKQSNKLTKIAQDSMKLFDSREDGCKFGHAYQAYWERRNCDSLRQNVSHPKEDEMDVDYQGESHLNTDDDYREKTSNSLKQMSALPSDEVGHLKIIDLSSESALHISQSEIPEDEFNNITNAIHIEPIVLSDYATELSNALQHCPPPIATSFT